jgi:hypothetical protein
VKLLSEWKFSTVDDSIQACTEDGCLVLSLLLLLAFNVIFVGISAMFVAIEVCIYSLGSGGSRIWGRLNSLSISKNLKFHS